MPCRKRKASRRLLFPAAFAPMRIVSGPSLRVASWKFLNRLRRMDSITGATPEGSMAASFAPDFILISIAKAGKGDRPSRSHSACLEVIAEVFEDNQFVPLFVTPGEFDQGLKEVEE